VASIDKESEADVTLEVVFIPRSGATAAGKDWDTFMELQAEVLTERASGGWDLVSVLDVVTPAAMREASRTGGVMLYFRRT
jgi:hypothetical protein